MIRNEDGSTVELGDIKEFEKWKSDRKLNKEINFKPARVLMQDFTGVPAVVDLASMRAAIKNENGDPKKINPLSPVDLVMTTLLWLISMAQQLPIKQMLISNIKGILKDMNF